MSDRKILLKKYLLSFYSFGRMMRTEVICQSPVRDMPKSQLELMMFLYKHGDQTVKLIAQHMQITSSAATQLVEQLVQAGLATRQDDPNDRRSVLVSLSNMGKKQLSELEKVLIQRLNSLFQGIPDTELKKIIEFQDKLTTKGKTA